MPFYSSYTASGYLANDLEALLKEKGISSFGLSKIANLSPTTTRKICTDEKYIPCPDTLEKICLHLDVEPGDVLKLRSTIQISTPVGSGVLPC